MTGATFAIAVTWTVLIVVTTTITSVVQAHLGANWGTMASHPLNPNIVVNLLEDNGIKKVKLFDSDSWTVSALAGSKIETIVGIPNDQLESLASDYNHAKDWVKENVTAHIYDGGVNIRFLLISLFISRLLQMFKSVCIRLLQNDLIITFKCILRQYK